MCASARPRLPRSSARVEGGGVDLEHRVQRLGGIERAEAHGRAVALAQLEHPAAREAQQPVHERARQAVAVIAAPRAGGRSTARP